MDRKIIRYAVFIVSIIVIIVIIFLRATTATVNNVASPSSTTTLVNEITTIPAAPESNILHYVEVVDGCNFAYAGDCVNLRSGPGTEYPSVFKLRTGIVLAVATTTVTNSRVWYKVIFIHPLLYPERVKSDLYVAADLVKPFTREEKIDLIPGQKATTTKRIIVDVSEQKLYAYEGDTLFMKEPISTGLEFTPTPKGVFTVFRMTPSRFMQGPIPGVSDQVYDLPGVPWNLYFTKEGAVIHGAYWHDHFGIPWSHGCVNLSPENAKKLYDWADMGMTVTVKK